MRPATIGDWLGAVVWATNVLAMVVVAVAGYQPSPVPPFWHGVTVGVTLLLLWPCVVRAVTTLGYWADAFVRDGR